MCTQFITKKLYENLRLLKNHLKPNEIILKLNSPKI